MATFRLVSLDLMAMPRPYGYPRRNLKWQRT